jgi:hypothetical protein
MEQHEFNIFKWTNRQTYWIYDFAIVTDIFDLNTSRIRRLTPVIYM